MSCWGLLGSASPLYGGRKRIAHGVSRGYGVTTKEEPRRGERRPRRSARPGSFVEAGGPRSGLLSPLRGCSERRQPTHGSRRGLFSDAPYGAEAVSRPAQMLQEFCELPETQIATDCLLQGMPRGVCQEFWSHGASQAPSGRRARPRGGWAGLLRPQGTPGNAPKVRIVPLSTLARSAHATPSARA